MQNETGASRFRDAIDSVTSAVSSTIADSMESTGEKDAPVSEGVEAAAAAVTSDVQPTDAVTLRAIESAVKSPPEVTYRHVLSAGSLNVNNPLRVIAHCDVDAAYAQFEAKRLGVDSHKVPLAVQQWNGLIAISYAARKFGISRHETVEKALEKCPELQLVHVATYEAGADRADYNEDPKPETHKISLDDYRRESIKIMETFRATYPSAIVEKASIDESYFDLSIEVRRMLVERYPELRAPPADSTLGMDTPLPSPPPPPKEWDVERLGHFVPVTPLPRAPPAATDVEGSASTPTLTSTPSLEPWTWTDVAVSLGAELMNHMRREIEERLGYTTSAGIANSKTLAKLCSSLHKPRSQTTMRLAATPGFLYDLPFQKIRFLGGKLGSAMAEEWDSKTVGDCWSVSLTEMQRRFGDESVWVYDVLRGVDRSEVQERTASKTMLASKNVRPHIKRTSDAMHWLNVLSTELYVRLSEARETQPNTWPKTLVLRWTRVNFSGRSRQAPFPYTRTFTRDTVFQAAKRLWTDVWGDAELPNPSGGGAPPKSNERTIPVSIIIISLGFSQLDRGVAGQSRIDGFFKTSSSGLSRGSRAKSASPIEEDEDMDHYVDTSPTPFQESTVEVHTLDDAGRSASRTQGKSASNATQTLRWTCPKCKIDVEPSSSEPANMDAAVLLDMAVQDHQDFHFALELQREQWKANESADSQRNSGKKDAKRKQRGEASGSGQLSTQKPSKSSKKDISKFFTRQTQG